MHFPYWRGVAYKKYFLPQESGTSLYTVPYQGNTYVYMSFFADDPRVVTFPKDNGRRLCWKARWTGGTRGDCLTASGAAGYAVFRLNAPRQKG